jgi:Bacterial SH3 domain
MNPAKNRERKCSTCKHYQPSPLWRKGWCRNPLLYDRNTNHLVEADSLACNRTFIDYWEPMTGPAPKAGPQARSSKPRIAPSIPIDTLDAQGRRTTVTGNTPAAGMAAVAPKTRMRPDEIPAKPALSLVTPDFDEVFGPDDSNATLQLEEVEGPRANAAAQGARQKQALRRRGLAALWSNTRGKITMILGAVVLLLLLGGGAWYVTRNNGKVITPSVVPTTTVAHVLATPTGFGDPTATVPVVATEPAAPPPTDHIAVNGWVQVGGTGSGLVVRDAPAKSGKRLTVMPDGTKAHVIDGPKDADGLTWWKVEGYNSKDPSASGWCAAQFLTPVPAP